MLQIPRKDGTVSPLLLKPEHKIYKPFKYPWAYEYWLSSRKMAWLAEEVPLTEDIKDWNTTLTPSEKNLITQIFRTFTMADIEVGGAYLEHYLHIFQPTEIIMMMSEFMAVENVHIAAYSYLLDTIGMPEVEYSAFLRYTQMKAKYDFMHSFDSSDLRGLIKAIAGFAAFTEGLQLYASFAILLNFPRFNKLKNMGQIIAWSSRDENLHVTGMLKVLNTLVDDYPEIWDEQMVTEIIEICRTTVVNEEAYVDLVFEMGPVQGLTANEVKEYLQYKANFRLSQLGIQPIYSITHNPLPWVDEMLNAVEHTNFFENKPSAYSKASSTGDWGDAFGE